MTRRTLLGLVPSGFLAAQVKPKSKRRGLPPARGEFVRFTDRVTENVVVRLTVPLHNSVLPARENRFVSSREGFLIFASDRSGVLNPFHANLRTGVITQMYEAGALVPESLALDGRDREVWFVDGAVLKAITLPTSAARTVAEDVAEFHVGSRSSIVVVRRGQRLDRLAADGPQTLADNVTSRGLVNPVGGGCVFGRREAAEENELWYAPFSGERPRLLAKGRVSAAYWRPDGQALLFLRASERNGYVASELREVMLDGSPEHLVAETSQFATFAPNEDGSVFVGASRSKAQPDVVLLLRQARREMVLCEHRAQQAETVSPAFSPNSQRVYFQSDHEGKSAIYSVNVERLVEATEDGGT